MTTGSGSSPDEALPRVLAHRGMLQASVHAVARALSGAGQAPVKEWNAATGKNIAWKTPLPGPSFAQPIVVGDKVFTLADPNWLICLSAVDGKILWQRAVDPTSVMAPERAARARAATAFWEDQFRLYSIWLDLKAGMNGKLGPRDKTQRWIRDYPGWDGVTTPYPD